MVARRKSLPIDVRQQVLHEAGYKCANPVCKHMLTLDIHHLVPISENGPDSMDNLPALCPNCHTMHHRGEIPKQSLIAWKMQLLSLNEGYDRKLFDMLITLRKVGELIVTGGDLPQFAPLIASDLADTKRYKVGHTYIPEYSIRLTKRGRLLIKIWKDGNQKGAFNI
jgi:hypothetical protein